MRKTLVLLICFAVFWSCKEDNNTSTDLAVVERTELRAEAKGEIKFEVLDPAKTGFQFDNAVNETSKFNHFLWASIYNGSGVGLADFNNDGNIDIYMGKNMSSDGLWFGNGDMTFENVSGNLPSDKRWTSGVSIVDINNDGHLDIYVCKFGPLKNPEDRRNQMLINDGTGKFQDMAAAMGIDDGGWSTQASFADFDEDGDLDIYLVNQPPDSRFIASMNVTNQDIANIYSDKLYIQTAPGKFTEQGLKYGISNYASGLNALVNDVNDDGWLDIYVANDYEKPDYFYINQEGKGFRNELEQRTRHISNFAMGSDVADINNDNLNDIAVLDMSSNDHYRSKTNMGSMSEANFWKNVNAGNHFQYMYNSLQLNQGGGYYSEIGHMAGIASTDWSWSILFEDFDRDGYKDAYVTNGIKRDIRNNDFTDYVKSQVDSGNKRLQVEDLFKKLPSNPISNFLFQNNGDLTFANVTTPAGVHLPDFSAGCGLADLDNDGDVDMVVSVSAGNSMILENVTKTDNDYIAYDIDAGSRNELLYSKLVIETTAGTQRRDFIPVKGYLSSMIDKVIFGLPKGVRVEAAYLETIYGDTYKLPTKAGQVHKVKKDKLKKSSPIPKEQPLDLFLAHEALQYTHVENEYNDFTNEVLLPHKLSEKGPFTAIGDLDGDGKPELVITGSKGQPMQVFTKVGGTWQQMEGVWSTNGFLIGQENQALAIYDADGDGDNDIYVGCGGNDIRGSLTKYNTDQLLINDGKGSFTQSTISVGRSTNTTYALPIDLDGEGPMELLVLSGHTVGRYPYSDPSHVYQWKGDQLGDVTTEVCPELTTLGSAMSAVLVDYDADGDKDVVVVGEWMEPTVLSFQDGKLSVEHPAVFSKKDSWWNTINTGDFNGDGNVDMVLGSFGLNNKFHPSEKKPLEVLGNDFDNNGKSDIVLAKHYKGKVVPTRGRECSSQQIPNILDKFPTYEEFAVAGLDEILGKEKMQEGIRKQVHTMSHAVVYGDGKGGWTYESLPSATQIAPLKSTVVLDLSGDGIDDIVGIGNHYGAEVETTRYDAGYGFVLLGSGNGLQYVAPKQAGIWFDGDGRSVEVIDRELFAFFNNAPAKAFLRK